MYCDPVQIFTVEILSRLIRMSYWRMIINQQNSAKHCMLDVRTKWTSCKFSDFLPWQSSMPAFCNATKVLSRNVLDPQKQTMSNAWWRLGILSFILLFLELWNYALLFYHFFLSISKFVLVIDTDAWVGCILKEWKSYVPLLLPHCFR